MTSDSPGDIGRLTWTPAAEQIAPALLEHVHIGPKNHNRYWIGLLSPGKQLGVVLVAGAWYKTIMTSMNRNTPDGL